VTTEGPAPVVAVSDGTGSSAEHLVRSMIVQFGDPAVPILKQPGIRSPADVEAAVDLARTCDAMMVVHTILAPELRELLQARCRELDIAEVDLVGGLLGVLEDRLGAPNRFRPGLFRRLHQEYFERVEAIDFAIKHDDGQSPGTLCEADVILLGPSRTGKTPLSMYLAMQGWKAANVPLVAGIEPPRELVGCDHRRMIGLIIRTDLLVTYREHRRTGLGALPGLYTDPSRVFHEMETARAHYRRLRAGTVDVTNKPIEASAAEVEARLARRVGRESVPGQET
jgi:regulator of PEP synthase PpsR (kinase-PPPase family)